MIRKIGLIAGEPSGDILGAGLISSLKQLNPTCQFYGVGGPKMISAGLIPLASMDALSVMGFVSVITKYFKLVQLNNTLNDFFLKLEPDVFIGIDSPDFNLPIEKKLKQAGIKTVHYVSPKIWAWRQYRVHKIKQSVDIILCLFPFELDFYRKFKMEAKYIGHPLADHIPLQPDVCEARSKLGIKKNVTLICVLPGSRYCELKHMIPLFSNVIKRLSLIDPKLAFVIPLLNVDIISTFKSQLGDQDIQNKVIFTQGDSRSAIEAADLVICKAGTCTLETLLYKKPMVVCFKTDSLTYNIVKRLVRVKHISLPNLLANKAIVPEFIQNEASIDNIVIASLDIMNKKSRSLRDSFDSIHKQLKCDASNKAAQVIMSFA